MNSAELEAFNYLGLDEDEKGIYNHDETGKKNYVHLSPQAVRAIAQAVQREREVQRLQPAQERMLSNVFGIEVNGKESRFYDGEKREWVDTGLSLTELSNFSSVQRWGEFATSLLEKLEYFRDTDNRVIERIFYILGQKWGLPRNTSMSESGLARLFESKMPLTIQEKWKICYEFVEYLIGSLSESIELYTDIMGQTRDGMDILRRFGCKDASD